MKSHGGEDDSTGLRTEHSLNHTAHAVRTAGGVQAVPSQQKQSVVMGSRPVPHLVFLHAYFKAKPRHLANQISKLPAILCGPHPLDDIPLKPDNV